MYWFCGVNDNSQSHKDMYLTALNSAKKNTTLIPILIYDGNDVNFINHVESYNGRIIKHKSLLSIKTNFNLKDKGWKGIASGAFLRLDIPIICNNIRIKDKTVLYTDTDVIFVKDVVSELSTYSPKYFSVCPESNKIDYTIFNSGVMLINVKAMYDTYIQFTTFMEINNYNFPAFDQGALQVFYKNKENKLPLYFNHKPYWGIDNNAKIIHYHGPKQHHIINYLNSVDIPNGYKCLFLMVNNNIWKYYVYLYEYYKVDFDWKYYLDKYPDLRKNGIHTLQLSIEHWFNYGKKEGRVCKK